MAKLKLGSIVTDVSGKLGGQVFGKSNGTAYMKNKTGKNRVSTLKQQNKRLSTKRLMALYSTLSEAERLLWFSQAKLYKKKDIFAELKSYNGFQLFQHVNQNRVTCNELPLISPNNFNTPSSPININANVSDSVMSLVSNGYLSTDTILIYATPSLSKGISSPRRYMRLVATATGTELNNGVDVMSNYLEVFKELQASQQIWIGIKVISNVSYFGNSKMLINKPAVVVSGDVPPVYDVDAQLFIDVVGTLTVAQEVIVNNLVLAYKAAGLWVKRKVLQIYIGGTSESHKYNLKNAADTDEAFRQTFVGGVVHDVNGVTFNGVNGYADTHFNPVDEFSATNNSFGIYIRSDSTENSCDMGIYNPVGGEKYFSLFSDWGGDLYSWQYTASGGISVPVIDNRGNYLIVQSSAILHRVFKNGVQLGTIDVTDTTAEFPNLAFNFFVGGQNNAGVLSDPSSRNYAFVVIGESLTPAEALTEYNIIQDYQTALGRQV